MLTGSGPSGRIYFYGCSCGSRSEVGDRLDILVSEGVPVGFSQMFIEAVMMDPNERLGRTLSMKTPSAALALTQTMYLTDGSPVQ